MLQILLVTGLRERHWRGTKTPVLLCTMDGDKWLPLLRMNLSFAGCGFLAIYHLGVAKALMMHGRKFLMNVQRFAGASAGALVAAALAVGDSDLQAMEVCLA